MIGFDVLDVSRNRLAQSLCSHVGGKRVPQIAQHSVSTGQGPFQDVNKWVNFVKYYIQDCICGNPAKVMIID